MLLTKKLKAGVLLYALFMSAIFVLLLQFYLGRVQAVTRQNQAQISASKAYLMAQVTLDEAKGKSGALSFKEGQASWERKGERVAVSVFLADGSTYQYDLVKVEEITTETTSISTEKSEPANEVTEANTTAEVTQPNTAADVTEPETVATTSSE